jgi:hypothetical protein
MFYFIIPTAWSNEYEKFILLRAFENSFTLLVASTAGRLDVLLLNEYQPGTPTIRFINKKF